MRTRIGKLMLNAIIDEFLTRQDVELHYAMWEVNEDGEISILVDHDYEIQFPKIIIE